MKLSGLVVMGVTGSGKTTVGQALANRLGWQFYDADDFHSAANIAKMSRGQPLTNADRVEWLAKLVGLLQQSVDHKSPLVLACSALKAVYRQRLQVDPGIIFVYLRGNYRLIQSRLAQRKNHFMNPNLLDSQFELLEEPADSLTIDIDRPLEAIVTAIMQALNDNRLPVSGRPS